MTPGCWRERGRRRWRGGKRAPWHPVAALSFAASADSQGRAVERAVETAKRVAARGGHALVLIDSLDGLRPHAALQGARLPHATCATVAR